MFQTEGNMDKCKKREENIEEAALMKQEPTGGEGKDEVYTCLCSQGPKGIFGGDKEKT